MQLTALWFFIHLAPAQAPHLDLAARAGPAFPLGEVAAGFQQTVGVEGRLDVAWRLTPLFSLGVMGEALSTGIEPTPSAAGVPLGSLSKPGVVWTGFAAAVLELHPREHPRLDPFVGLSLGWAFTSSTHGPTAGLDVGLDVRPWARWPVAFGLVLEARLALLSYGSYTVGTSTRLDASPAVVQWGTSFSASGWLAPQLRVAVAL